MSAEDSPRHGANKSSCTEDQPSSILPGAGANSLANGTQQLQQIQLASFPFTTRELLREDEMHEVLQLSSSQVSQTTASNASALVQLSNSEKSHERLQQLLPLYFYSWNLTDAHSVIVFLLLHYFLLRREHREVLGAKGIYEEHIALLKSRMSDLEEKLSNSHSQSGSGSSSSSSPRNGNIAGGDYDQALTREIESLHNQVASLRLENEQLKHSNEEVCRINEQWALDYQILSDQVKNATGFYSIQSGGSSAHSSARASPVPASMLTQNCLQCSQMELRLDAKREAIRALEREVEDVKSELKMAEIKLERKDEDIARLNSENHAILLQLQEIGDLQAAVKMKHDYRKLQYQLSQTNKQYQEAVSEKLQYQKQVEKLRQAFLSIFPFTSLAPQNVIHSTSEGYSSFPMRTCRRQHHNQYPFSDPAPPTPPGLIARGDHHGSLVEKDEQSLSSQPAHPSLPNKQPPHHASSSDDHMKPQQTLSLRPVQARDSLDLLTSTLNHQRHSTSHSSTSESHGSHVIKQHQLLVPESGPPSVFTPSSSNGSIHNSSQPHLTTSDYSSSKSLPQYGTHPSTHPSSSSQQTSFTGYSSTHTTSSGLSSGSAGGGVAMTTTHYRQAPPMIHAPNSHGQSLVVGGHPNYFSSSTGALSVGKDLSNSSSSLRPTSLTITRPPGRSIKQQPASMMSSLHHQNQQQKVSNQQQQKFECPSCRKQFPYGPQDFDQWFEHIRYCENKP